LPTHRYRRAGPVDYDIISVHGQRHRGHPAAGTGPASPEGRDAAPSRRCAAGPGAGQARREERRGRQDVPDETAGQVLERPGQALGQQVRQPQERQTVVVIILRVGNNNYCNLYHNL